MGVDPAMLLKAIFGPNRFARPTKVQVLPCKDVPAGAQKWVRSVDEIVQFSRDHDGVGGTLGFCPALFDGENDTETAVAELRSFRLDFDGKDGLETRSDIYSDEQARKLGVTSAIERLNIAEKLLGKCTAATMSGYGIHADWLFESPLRIDDGNRPIVKSILRKLALSLGADKACATLGHYYRIPGSTNWKGAVPRACTVVALRPAERVTLEHLASVASRLPDDAAQQRAERAPRARRTAREESARRTVRSWDLDAGLWTIVSARSGSKVGLALSRDGKEIHRDRLNLDSATSRSRFAKCVAPRDDTLQKCVESDLLTLAQIVATLPEVTNDMRAARTRFCDETPIDFDSYGRACPMCLHDGCFGPLQGDARRWSCFSDDHGEDSGGRGLEGPVVWHGDAADIAAHARRLSVHEFLIEAGYLAPGAPVVAAGDVAPYESRSDGIYWLKPTKEGRVPVKLTNFSARIVEEILRDDGVEQRILFRIEAKVGAIERTFSVTSEEFAFMGWPLRQLGAGAIVEPGMGLRDAARAAIQYLSGTPPRRTVYTHTGWGSVGGRDVFLHRSGALGPGGPVAGVEVDLPGELSRYELPPPVEGETLCKAIRASLDLCRLAPAHVSFPLLAGAYRVVIAPIDLGLHTYGVANSFKTELNTLILQHFGPSWRRTNLTTWSSTENSIEHKAFVAKDVPLVVDDFVPTGSTFDVARKHQAAERVFRAQGNLSGRSRLAGDGTLRASHPPRGMIFSTGEELPRGESLGTRMLGFELRRGDIDKQALTLAQAIGRAGVFAQAMSSFIVSIAGRLSDVRARLEADVGECRAKAFSGGYPRCASNVAELMAGFRALLRFALEKGAIDESERDSFERKCWTALEDVARRHTDDIATADQVNRFFELLRSALTSGVCHVRQLAGGPPPGAANWGWRERDGHDRLSEQGRCIGYLDGPNLYLEPDAALAAAQAVVGSAGDGMTISARTLAKRLNAKGRLVKTGVGRNRLKVRVQVDGVSVELLHVRMSDVYPEDTRPDGPPAPGAPRVDDPGRTGPGGTSMNSPPPEPRDGGCGRLDENPTGETHLVKEKEKRGGSGAPSTFSAQGSPCTHGKSSKRPLECPTCSAAGTYGMDVRADGVPANVQTSTERPSSEAQSPSTPEHRVQPEQDRDQPVSGDKKPAAAAGGGVDLGDVAEAAEAAEERRAIQEADGIAPPESGEPKP